MYKLLTRVQHGTSDCSKTRAIVAYTRAKKTLVFLLLSPSAKRVFKAKTNLKRDAGRNPVASRSKASCEGGPRFCLEGSFELCLRP